MKNITSNKNHTPINTGTVATSASASAIKATINYTNISLQPKIFPIHPTIFADLMEIRIKSLNPGFHCGGKIRDGFIQYGTVYNHCVEMNSKGNLTQLVVPAATGSGKTVSATLYLSEISKIEMSGLLVVSEISVAIEAANTINNLAEGEVAGVYYFVNDKNPKCEFWHNIDDLPRIAIITHAMFIQRSDSGKDIELLRSFNGKQRDVVIIDERIDLTKRVSFGTDEIVDAVAILKRDCGLHGYAKIVADFNDGIFISEKNGTFEMTGKFEQAHTSLKNTLSTLITRLYAKHFNILPKMRGKIRNTDPDRANVIDLFTRIVFVIDGRYTHTVEGKNVVCHREEDLSNKFGSVVVLDATATVNPEYDFRSINNHDVMMFNRIKSRNYSNVVLNICPLNGPKQSKWAIYTNPKKENKLKEIVLAYLRAIGSLLDPDDKLLVATYKDVVPLFAENNPYKDQVKFIHWGGKDARGSNDFKDFNKAIIIGWHRRPVHYYVASVMAINQVNHYVNTTGSIWSDANHLKDMLIVDDMIQFFNRVRCRTAIDKNGNCNPVELYCLTGGNYEIEEIIRTSFESEMPNIVISDWKPKEIQTLKGKVTKIEERAELFIKYLRGRIEKYGEIHLTELRQYFGLSPYSVSVVIKSDIFNNFLVEEAITMIQARGKGNPVRFILPVCKV